MPVRFGANISVRSRSTTGFAARSPGLVLLGLVLLVGGCIFFLWQEGGFALYALTGFRWIHTDGTVTNTRSTSNPKIQFIARDGSPVLFNEDYILLCGRRSFCWIRDFQPGQVVPVVYDPTEPRRAYVHDWALFATALTWFLMAGIALLLALLACLRFIKPPASFSIRMGPGFDPPTS